MDFVSYDCLPGTTFNSGVLFWAFFPLSFSFLSTMIYCFQRLRARGNAERCQELTRSHVQFVLAIMYCTLPAVLQRLLQSLDCIEVAGDLFVRVDTAQRCDSKGYKNFLVLCIALITIYSSIPLLWTGVLWSKVRLSPEGTLSAQGLDPFRILFSPYKPNFFFFETVDIYRRILFVGLLPLTTSNVPRRAALGMFFSMISALAFRELQPFHNLNTNLLLYVASWAVRNIAD